MRTLTAAAVLCLSSATASAFTGEQLLEYCSAPAGQIVCRAYIMGLADGLGTYPETRPYCPPEKLTIAQIQRIVEKFLQDNPAKLHHEAADLEAQALQLAFPCRQNSN